MRSGLVRLLDQLCSLVDDQKPLEVGGEEDESLHRVMSLAWAAFQVLADHCVSWETGHSTVLSSGLAQQVGNLHVTGSYFSFILLPPSPGIHTPDQPPIPGHGPTGGV